MPKVEPPAIQPIESDIALFAKAYFNIDLTREQLGMIDAMAHGRQIIKHRKMGLTMANKIIKAYLLEGLKPGGAYNFELSRFALKYTSVISELRKDGYDIVADRQYLKNGKASNTWRYRLGGQ